MTVRDIEAGQVPPDTTLVAFDATKVNDDILDIFIDVAEERDRQDRKWGREFPGRRDSFWYAILLEEIGEVAETILKGEPENMHEELIQCAAVIFAWLELRDGTPEDEVENIEEISI